MSWKRSQDKHPTEGAVGDRTMTNYKCELTGNVWGNCLLHCEMQYYDISINVVGHPGFLCIHTNLTMFNVKVVWHLMQTNR